MNDQLSSDVEVSDVSTDTEETKIYDAFNADLRSLIEDDDVLTLTGGANKEKGILYYKAQYKHTKVEKYLYIVGTGVIPIGNIPYRMKHSVVTALAQTDMTQTEICDLLDLSPDVAFDIICDKN